MFKTKKELDDQFRPQLAKLRTEAERYLRGYTVAKVYYKNNIYDSAEQYLLSYLTVKEDNDQAHKLLGQCYQRLKKPEKALQAFQHSLQLNSKQPDVLVEVCKLLLDDDKSFNVKKAKYWCEMAESEKVQNEVVFSLRLKLLNKENQAGSDQHRVEALIQKEISARPDDVGLRVRLVRTYLEQNQLLDAYRYVQQLEASHRDAFAVSGEWYNVVWLVLSKYEQTPNTVKDWQFWLLIATCLERQVFISFGTSGEGGSGGDCSMSSSATETANLLFTLDQYLFKITQLPNTKLNTQPELVTLFLAHYRGQLLLHAAALLFKRELQQNKNKWRETVRSALPLLLLSFQTLAPEAKQQWMQHCDEQGKQLVQLWHREGSFRCAQVGRTLLSCISEEIGEVNKENNLNQSARQQGLWKTGEELLLQLRQTFSDKQWRRGVFALLFCNSDQRVKEQSSLLVRSAELAEPCFELPTYADVERYEEAAQFLRPQSLPHMVYLCLANDKLAYVRAKCFGGLKFSTQNLAFCGAESLNQLDMEAFLYASTLQAQFSLALERDAFEAYNAGSRDAESRPLILPFTNIRNRLCSEEQVSWWLTAYQFYKDLSIENVAEARAVLQFGIEAVRCTNGPRMDMMIVFRLGEIFVARAKDAVKAGERASLEARAENVYRHGLSMMKLHTRGALEPFRKYFKYARRNASAVERQLSAVAEEATRWLASRLLNKGEYEELIDELGGVQLPFATYLQAEAYRKLGEAKRTPMQVKRQYLERAGECLNQTVELLRGTNIDPDHTLNAIVHSELRRVQQAAARYANNNDSGGLFSSSSIEGASQHQQQRHNNSSTYEDAEEEFFSPTLGSTSLGGSGGGGGGGGTHRMRRDPHVIEMEALIKQMSQTLNFVRDKVVDVVAPDMVVMQKELSAIKLKVEMIDDAMKKQNAANARHSSNPPSRDDASQLLDDMYIFEDTMQHQQHQLQQQPLPPQMHSNLFAGSHYNQAPTQAQQARIHTPNAAQQLQQNAAAVAAAAAAAYGSPLFNPNYSMNYYGPSPYMLAPQAFNTMPTTAPLLAQPNADTRGLYGLLPQQQQQQQQQQQHHQQQHQHQMPQLPAVVPPMTQLPHLAPPSTALNGIGGGVVATAPAQSVAQFNKSLNNQPVEKGPPANVVITSSDPLPNPNTALAQTQQPTLSVTIPSHHIKPSLLVQTTPEALVPQSQPQPAVGSVFGGAFTGSPFASFSSVAASATTVAAPAKAPPLSFGAMTAPIVANVKPSGASSMVPAVSAISNLSTFSFKPQVLQAAAAAAAAAQNEAAAGTGDATSDDSKQLNKTGESNASGGGAEIEAEYDPRPDFQPIIPLPDEIEVRTGEEDEEVMFCQRAKLFRLVDREWKERGIGDMKILKSKASGNSRILMRRELTHKICANHVIRKSLILEETKNETKGCIWAADDFADEKMRREKFFVRFRQSDTAIQFQQAFKTAQLEDVELECSGDDAMPPPPPTSIVAEPAKSAAAPTAFGLTKSAAVSSFATSTPTTRPNSTVGGGGGGVGLLAKPQQQPQQQQPQQQLQSTAASSSSKTLFGGLNQQPSSTTSTATAQVAAKPASVSPFANFSFDKSPVVGTTTSAPQLLNIFSNLSFGSGGTISSPFASPAVQQPSQATSTTGSDGQMQKSVVAVSSEADGEEYVPTAEFKPVIALPELIDVTTGEENEAVLFEHRAKLLRFDKAAGEWKDRGVGNIKLLQDKADPNQVRLVMRREQIHKLCCNQRLHKDTVFNYAKNTRSALTWAGQDFSEKELVTQLLTVRFKTVDTCEKFHAAILAAQAAMDDSAEEGNGKCQEDLQHTEKDNEKKEGAVSLAESLHKGFGDAFKPKAGSWVCTACCVLNSPETLYCLACETPKDDTVPKEVTVCVGSKSTQPAFSFGFTAAGKDAASPAAASIAKPAFTFGMTPPAATPVATPKPSSATPTTATAITGTKTPTLTSIASMPASAGFGDAFKQKAGTWNCEACYLSNAADTLHCKACDAPKDATVPKKEVAAVAFSLSATGAPKFSFGFAAAGAGSDVERPPATTDFGFGGKPAATATGSKSSEPLGTLLFGKQEKAAAGDTSKSFNFTQPSATSTTLGKANFSFTLPSKGNEAPNKDGSVAATSDNEAVSSSTQFSLDKKEFCFTLKPKSPGRSQKLSGGGDADIGVVDDGGGDDDTHHEEEENNTYFTPVIPLPDKIEVLTGEENEELLYVHRAKLYRFVDAEWKERGLGDVKILRHKETGSLRVVMRRDQVHKICLNHGLNAEVNYYRKDDKSWSFVANDFTEGAVELLSCSLRFKTKEIAEAFKAAVDAALAGTATVVDIATKNNSNSISCNNNNKDHTSIASLAAEAEAAEAASPCPGCRGCDPDAFEFPPWDSDDSDNLPPPLPTKMPLLPVPPQQPITPAANAFGNRFALKQSALKPAPSSTSATSSDPAETNLFAGIGGDSSTNVADADKKTAAAESAVSKFSFSAALKSCNKPDGVGGGFLFGNTANAANTITSPTANPFSGGSLFSGTGGGGGDSKALFGQPGSIFGGVSSTTTTTSIFGGVGSASVTSSAPSDGSVFGGKPSIFSGIGPPKTTSIFGNLSVTAGDANSFLFGGAQDKKDNDTNKEQPSTRTLADLSEKAGGLDFAALAAQINTGVDSNAKSLGPRSGPSGFFGLTNQNAFTSFSSSIKNTSANSSHANGTGDDDGKASAANDENYDPHYDPIIALPKEIVVSTGEEHESKLFGERATLFRWNPETKEWKERGVGELKLLEHRTLHTHRLVMRREQIHKLVLNHAIGDDFNFENMNNPKSFAWATMNFAESSDGELEKLAVRFKKVELAEQFSQQLHMCIAAAKQRATGDSEA